MAVDPQVLKGLAMALAADPSNSALRVHYADLLLDDGQHGEALAEARLVLTEQPASIEALTVAHQAATALGADEAALGYRQLLGALGAPPAIGEPSAPPTAPDAAPSPPPAREPIGDWTPSAAELEELVGIGDPDAAPPSLTLDDVAGMEQVKDRLRLTFLGPARDPALRAAFRANLRGGLLLYGPPGCGKTFIARALAGELRASFISVGIADVLDMWVGSSERNLHDVFERARTRAPAVVFLDELDALGMRRSSLRNSPAMSSTVNQLLTELDGVASDNDGVFVLAATNQPWEVDPALRRPGRFDRTLLVLPPDEPARLAILTRGLADRPISERLRLDRIASSTDGWSGADLTHLCDSAAELALERSLRAGKIEPVTDDDLQTCLRQIGPSTGSWFDVAQNVARFANRDGTYDDLKAYLGRRRR